MTLDKAGSGSVEARVFNAVVDALQNGTLQITAADIDSQAAQDGEVLTANGSGNATWEAGGSAGPGAVRRLDLGVITMMDLQDGPITLYDTAAGELVGPVYLRDVTYPDGQALIVARDEQVQDDPTLPCLAYIDSATLAGDGAGLAAEHQPAFGIVPTTTGPVRAGVAGDPLGLPYENWQALTVYDALVQITGDDAHVWRSDADGGTSGATIPNFAAHHSGTVTDNDITWTDRGALPTVGSMHVYADVCTPDTP